MARIDVPPGDGEESVRVWALRPEMAKGVGSIVDAAYHKSRLPAREREAARMRIAQLNECPACLTYRATGFAGEVDEALYAQVANFRESSLYTAREKLAIEYAERFAQNHLGIDDDFFARLRAAFADDEILDLTICLATFLGLGRMMTVLGIETEWSRATVAT
jgi:alkylhydroperoxidase family enzyme